MENDRSNIELIKEKTDIVSVISRYVKLSQAGKNFKGLCPFHNEKTPSFNVSPDLNIYKCFGCSKSGDVINFIEEIENLDFNQALEKLAKEAGVSLEQSNKPKSPVLQINEWAKIYFQKELKENRNKFALDYLIKRGINEKQISDFEIGYAPGNGQFLQRLMKYKKYPKSILIDSGLFVEYNGGIKEKFNKRIMFPIHNISGKIVAFTGRKLPNNELGPKYLNSPETSIYQKRNNLYGLYQAKASIKKNDLCIILEGQTDVISLNKVGFGNAVAPLGTGLTESQLELIKRYTNNLLFIFDNDTAGQEALERAFRMCLELNLNTYALNTGKYKDIDELIQEDIDEFKKLIEKRTDTFTYLLTRKIEKQDITQLKSLKFIERYVISILDLVTNETEKKYYIQKAKTIIPQLSISDDMVESVKNMSSLNISKDSKMTLEDIFLKTLLKNLESLPEFSNYNEVIESPEITEILRVIYSGIKDFKEIKKALGTSTKAIEKFENIVLLEIDVDNPEIIKRRLLKNYYENNLKRLRILLALAEEKEDTKRIKELLEQVMEFTDKLKNIKHENI